MAKQKDKQAASEPIAFSHAPPPPDEPPAIVAAEPPVEAPAPPRPAGFEVRLQHSPTLRCRELSTGSWEVWEPNRAHRWTVDASDPFEAYKAVQGITGSRYVPDIAPLLGE